MIQHVILVDTYWIQSKRRRMRGYSGVLSCGHMWHTAGNPLAIGWTVNCRDCDELRQPDLLEAARQLELGI